ncbi:glycoside hydrolase family 2 TIM barrel-domain containing protein [Sphingobacterium corticis]|uniref:Glycoside hydrolase family 2 TIM barrel-domain containing protein n=1 Tax=Sphingobacterium corticis TaxID=1812823 RepID=A0ABW5NLZ8_9SPHI
MQIKKLTTLLFLGWHFVIPNLHAQQKPIPVRIKENQNSYQILREDKPYFILGAGGTGRLEELKAAGGNSIRTWSTDGATEILDEAQRLGLTVTLGIRVSTERHGFDYNDQNAVKEQLERIRQEIQPFKNHPALLAWGIGNELNLHYSNEKVWDAVNDIATMLHEEDPNHLVTTMLAGVNKKEIDLINSKCPALDLIAVQVYGTLASVPQQLKDAGWNKAYMVTEWGPTGHWEGLQTPWKASIEETSSEKAAVYKSRYEASIAKDSHCVGSYVFLWGQKQERTPTWYGLFTEKGEQSEVIDVMQYLWTGSWPTHRAPHIDSFTINDKKAADHVYLKPGTSYPVAAQVSDPQGNAITARWELLPESTDLKEGGDRENRPKAIQGLLKENDYQNATLTAPKKEGAYRLFYYASDGNGKVATANIPFFVKK